MGETLDAMLVKPGRLLRSAEEMSQLAPFVDAATSIDRTNFENTFISYYTFGEAIGLGLDLTLRDRTDGRITLDDYMRALWEKHGKPGGRLPGYVDAPYTMADLEATLAGVSGDTRFAREFFERYIRGRELVDYARLLERAGLLLRRVAPGSGFAGDLHVQDVEDHARITAPVPLESPAYDAGFERDDVIVSIGGAQIETAADVDRTIQMHKAGDVVPVVFERRGQRVTGQLRLIDNPHVELVPAEMAGKALTPEQQQFRETWLSSGAARRR
jgi:predicted metalloprotease with PDZ domain